VTGIRANVLALAVILATTPAAALVGDTAGAGGLDGSIRTLAAGLVHYDFPPLFGDTDADALSQSVLRLTLAGRPHPALSYELHAVESADYTTGGGAFGTAGFGLVPGAVRYRALDLAWRQHERPDRAVLADVDRANATLHLARADVTVGRQAITFGKTYLWNPLDLFLAFEPQQFDREYKPGVDAMRVDVPLGPFSGVNLVGAAGRTIGATPAARQRAGASWAGSAVVARAFTTVGGFDLALQGGKVFGGWQAGLGATGEIGPLEARIEATGLLASASPPLLPGLLPPSERLVEDAAEVVVGTGHRFDNTLTLEAEYFYNGAGDPVHRDVAFTRLLAGATLGVSEHLAGLLATYDLLPILVGQLGCIVSLDDPSVQVLPQLTWSATDEVELLAGAIVSRGARPALRRSGALAIESEFGTFSDVVYVEVKAYF
jgi:hypothetical protein